jgi:hypothetical protein
MKSKGIADLAEQVASKGRHGDSILMHIQPDELAGISALLGEDVTINPETGMPEAFSWKKLLLAAGLGVGAILTGGATAPLAAKSGLLGLIGKGAAAAGKIAGGIVPKALTAAAVDQGVGALAPKTDGKSNQASEQNNEREYARQIFPTFRPKMIHNNKPQDENMIGNALSMSPIAMAEGGQLEPEEQKAQQIVSDAMEAIRGGHPDPESALNTYIAYYGQDALRDLYSRMSGNESEEDMEEAPQAEGMIKGPGNGMDDMATARMAQGGQKVLLSNDEFIIPADVVSGLGDGSSESGARKLYAMMDRVRKERTGTTKQPGKVKDHRVLPA